ncbi:CoA-binding protein [Saprospira grandis]|uniref:CoA-binding protein n=1 Tax=Saprospira grandis TaxID=1008 RepID=UPI0022DD6569|nr:CoA-binding protein [Saprospira grandis]WBM74012.1 CoA-binding protein [Saprospira grandis]
MSTLIIGASSKPDRYAYEAARRLLAIGETVYPLGYRAGKTAGDLDILTEFPDEAQIDSITLYLRPSLQKEYFEQIVALAPKRIIFNPGTENPAFQQRLQAALPQAEIMAACTLVLINLEQY